MRKRHFEVLTRLELEQRMAIRHIDKLIIEALKDFARANLYANVVPTRRRR